MSIRVEGIPPKLDSEKVRNLIVSEIRRYFEKAGRKVGVLGLSGGVDSSVTLALTVEALGPENTYVYLLPSRATSEESLRNAKELIRIFRIPPGNYRTINIDPILRTYDSVLNIEDKYVEGNTMARIRMTILYAEANRLDGLVVGTGDKSELYIGYFTKYGDGGVDLLPIGDIYKTQLREFALDLGIPRDIAYRPSSPELWRGQTAEGELGITYEEIDKVLYLLIDMNYKVEDIIKLGIDREIVEKVYEMVIKSEHKRRMPYIIKLPT